MGLKVLIVEDDYIAQLTLEKILKDIGFKDVLHASSIESATEKMKKDEFSLLLLDIYYKGEEMGISFAKQIKEEKPTIGVVLHTALSRKDVEQMIEGSEEIDAVIYKPYNYDRIKETLGKWLS
jgi:response regulator of citrate/malate metabolism